MTTARAFRGFRFPAEVILWAVRWYVPPVPHQLPRPRVLAPGGGRAAALSRGARGAGAAPAGSPLALPDPPPPALPTPARSRRGAHGGRGRCAAGGLSGAMA